MLNLNNLATEVRREKLCESHLLRGSLWEKIIEMNRLAPLLFFCLLTTVCFAQQAEPKEDNGFKIVGIVTLLGALVMALFKLKNTYRK